MTAASSAVSGTIRSTIPARLDRLSWSPFHTRMVAGLGAAWILDGLQITARTAGNSIIEDAIMATRKSVEEGKTISEPLGDTEVFPPMVVQMIAVGEQTGALDTMLSKIADFYEDEVDVAVAGLMKLLEPVLIAFLGVAIGGIVIAMYMPMFSLIGQIG